MLYRTLTSTIVFLVFVDIYQRVALSKSGKPGILSTMVSFFVSALWHVRFLFLSRVVEYGSYTLRR